MKKVTLDISHRLHLLSVFNEFKGGISLVVDIQDAVRDIQLSEKEIKDWNFVVADNRYTWNEKKAQEKEVELKDTVVEYVLQYIKDKDERGEFTLQDSIVLSLKVKLE